jgi:hemoglobin
MAHDISSFDDVKLLVDRFYETAGEDTLIGPIFNKYLEGRWEEHHKKLYSFWATVLLRQAGYYGNPVPMHFKMHLTEVHFNRWLQIWCETVDKYFEGEKAENAKHRGKTMSLAFMEKIDKANKP